ncbi:carboxypeptidase-like regulatory domain-containing protein [Kribbella sp. NPDC004875]|uniref:carboxypeptidase-like regulatory domain-containing protein n=1 Tax=Kribbella sp. NPDC004875 TaxID=3364107 RepID=UPI003675EC74
MNLKRALSAASAAVLVGVGIFAAGLFGGGPASAATSVSAVSFSPSPAVGGASADWTVKFTTSNGSGGQLNPGSTITATFNAAFTGLPQSPAVTLGPEFGNCSATASTSNSVVTITLVGAGCKLSNKTQGTLTLRGITNAPSGTYPASTFKLSTSSDTNAVQSDNAVTLTAGAVGKLAFVQAPADGFVNTPLSPAITVQVQDQYGNPVPNTPVTLTSSPSGINLSATSDANGRATFSSVVFGSTALGVNLIASTSNGVSVTSASFTVTVLVSGNSTLTAPASDSGSGVKSVAYYYCAGYSGTCANGTLIGSSTSAASNYQVTWSSRPAAGAYRVVAISTDNVANPSAPTESVPVTVG